MKTQTLFPILVSVFIMSGCSTTPQFVALPDQVKHQISSTQPYLEEGQIKMIADIESSNIATYTGGGLLFGLMDCAVMAYRQDRAEGAMEDLQKEFASYGLQEKVMAKLTTSFQQTGWLHADPLKVLKAGQDPAQIVQTSTKDGVLFTSYVYRFNPKMTVMRGTIYLSLYPASTKLKNLVKADNPFDKPLFRFNVSAAYQLPSATNDLHQNAKQWAAENGRHLKEALNQITTQNFIQFERALKNPAHIADE
ncbi:hypothetical protein [Candidatus Odyssella thessalonicensis]|uniref:hypothetical protein n=1 Tax=Candidatus Odyssella thessalonicensis TaxID=84647 RepID=UPI000225BB36|nr:hypothetical protein [Candidatus Odyssella thessalonicensis]